MQDVTERVKSEEEKDSNDESMRDKGGEEGKPKRRMEVGLHSVP